MNEYFFALLALVILIFGIADALYRRHKGKK